jgi:D-apionate oxidoisomerase
MNTVVLYGAAGKMGRRLGERLQDAPEIRLLAVELGPARDGLERDGFACVDADHGARQADVVVLAVPDTVIGPLAGEIVPLLRPGALVMTLDPAATHADRLPVRDGIAYFVAHPTHPPIFPEDFDRDALDDHFGEGKARQSIVCALVQGEESDYALGEELASIIWGPVLRSHRITVEQMAILEPALSETLLATCLTAIREGMDEAVARGVPAAAARDFLFGHLRVELAMLFDVVPFAMSDGALQAIEEARSVIFQPDWKERVFDPAEVRASTLRITEPADGRLNGS